MQGVVAEADLRLAETKKLGYEFDRDIIRGAVNPVSSAVFLCLSVLVTFGATISLSLSPLRAAYWAASRGEGG